MDYSRRSAAPRISDSPQHIYSRNHSRRCPQGPTIKIINSDTGDSGELYHCQCGQDIYPSPRRYKPAASPTNSVVTYKKQIGRDKMLVVKQELDAPVVTIWVAFHAIMFIFFFLLVLIILQLASLRIRKADEIMAVLALLLFVLIYFQPRYFLPFFVFQLGTYCKT
ncbi:unnamed protein product [Candidula unifasciata]|uniref:Uncharacterized protein n=1 Tax=Candidula unifasciata TaxID=100452 RepID=A0A8S3YLP3_9EUPU|nr:unnamed protein product [Candidula unifasciata]